ncbi:sensor domain-containing protein [Nocardioides stalactiti]|uniref:sensor domain-containing protein n=1 Tax=Nocardioides stalactiti TaxID=2755356 RepID=UPI0015FEDB05|nr:PAS domain S-box protein [Nocardioides stalactiti]
MSHERDDRRSSSETEHERRFRLVIEAAPNAMVMVDHSGSVVLVNSQAESLFGYDRDALLAMKVEDLLPERYRDVHHGYRGAFFADPARRDMGAGRELYGLRSDGTEVPIEIGLNPIRIDGDDFVLASIIDVTARLEALAIEKEALREHERRLRLVIEAAPNAMVMVDHSGTVVLVNSQAENLFGYDRDALLAMKVEDLLPQRIRGGHVGYRDAFFAAPARRDMGVGRELYGLRSDGTEVPIEIGLNPINIDGEDFVLASIIDVSARLEALAVEQEAMREHERRLTLVIEAAPNAMVMVDRTGSVVLVNSQAENLFGHDRDTLLAMKVEDLLPERIRGGHVGNRDAFFADPARRDMGVGRDLFGLRSDGTEVPIEIGLNPIKIDGEPYVLASIIDIRGRVDAQAAEQDELRRSMLDSIPFSILATDSTGRIVSANAAAERMLGYTGAELIGASLGKIDTEPRADGADWDSVLSAAVGAERELTYRRKDGTVVPVSEAITPLHGNEPDAAPAGYLAVAYDISERLQAQAEVQFLENHDPLTKIPTRSRLMRHLGDAIEAAEQDGTEVAVLVVDLDHLKRINDSLGHHAGDELLVRIADRLNTWIRSTDMVARLGGDEFAIVMSSLQNADAITPRVEALLEDLLTTVAVGGHELAVTVSIGGAIYPPGDQDPGELLKRADLAMEHAKAAGRNNFQWFRDDMLDPADDGLTLVSALRQALRDGGLSVAYQSQVDLRSGRVVGIEALARWHHPDLGEVSPGRFIPVAEDGGMIVQLGGWVLRKACRDVAQIQKVLGRPLRVAVNVSPHQFRSAGWLGEIVGALNDSGLDPAQLELEITESLLMDDRLGAMDMLHAIRSLGVTIAVDDFGTGYSSLAYLSRLPIDKIKIDRSFVQELDTDDHAPVIDAIIMMAHALGMTVIAEGVETAKHEGYLRQRGCDEVQGFFYSRGVPPEDVVRTVQTIGVF